MANNGRISDIYKQLEEVINKCDNLSLKVKTIEKDTSNKYKDKIKQVEKDTEFKVSIKYEKIISDINIRVEKLEEDNLILKDENTKLKENNQLLSNEVDRLKKQVNNDSSNSSLPPSTDIKKNIPNNRAKTRNKVGGQEGHKPHNLSKKDIEDKILSGEYKQEVISVGNISEKYISKYVLDIEVNAIAKEYRFYPDVNGKYNIPKEFQSDVQYGNELKTMCAILSSEGVVAVDRLTDFVSSITHGKINIANSTIINFLNTLSNKCIHPLLYIEEKILNAELIYTDATTARADNKNVSARNYSTISYTLLKATKGKSKKDLESTNILPRFCGDLIHDHETVMYNYGRRHGECNVHSSRYLTGCYQNTNNNWCLNLKSFLNSLNRYKKNLMLDDINCISPQNLNKYSIRYDAIIAQGYEQNKKTKSKYYAKEELKLLNRLKKYKGNHLLYIYDFTIPFDNNLSERDLRHVKTKQKISGYFKSMAGLQNYLDVKSIISTCKKQNKDFYKTIYNIYANIPINI